jgi:hypothetical protein
MSIVTAKLLKNSVFTLAQLTDMANIATILALDGNYKNLAPYTDEDISHILIRSFLLK